MSKSCRCRHKKYFTTYIDMLFQSNGTPKYLKTTKSCQTFWEIQLLSVLPAIFYTTVAMCAVVYPGSFFVLWTLINQSFQSPYPEVGMVSLLYDSVTEQLTVFVQNLYKSRIMCPHVIDMSWFFYRYVDMKKRSRWQPYLIVKKTRGGEKCMLYYRI